MITLLYAVVYNLIVFPVIFLTYHLLALTSAKHRQGIAGRYRVNRAASYFRRQAGNAAADLFLFHCASMGEFEHLKPLIRDLKERLPQSRVVIMFFSPSGYENVKHSPGVDLILYSPFDWWLPVYRVFRSLRPRALLIAKYDAWPNQVWIAAWCGVPRFLVNATLYDTSSRLWAPTRWLLRPIYSAFTYIFAISETDARNFEKLASPAIILTVGDTKYDQVMFRSRESRKKNVLPSVVPFRRQVLICGSTWLEDEAHLLPAIRDLSAEIADLFVVICPHEPTPSHIAELEKQLSDFQVQRLSQMNEKSTLPGVLLIDQVGVLANLYALASVAFVGGGFQQNVHNVLEPAAYGIPVLFGPVNRNAHEAQLLKNCGGGIEVTTTQTLVDTLRVLFADDTQRTRAGRAAANLIASRRGATEAMTGKMLTIINR